MSHSNREPMKQALSPELFEEIRESVIVEGHYEGEDIDGYINRTPGNQLLQLYLEHRGLTGLANNIISILNNTYVLEIPLVKEGTLSKS